MQIKVDFTAGEWIFGDASIVSVEIHVTEDDRRPDGLLVYLTEQKGVGRKRDGTWGKAPVYPGIPKFKDMPDAVRAQVQAVWARSLGRLAGPLPIPE